MPIRFADTPETTDATEGLSKHTPGPWEVRWQRKNPAHMHFVIDALHPTPTGEPQRYVASSERFTNPDNALADAHLIAAAPEMLEALKALRNVDYNTFEELDQLLSLADKAIAKAEGA